MVTENTTQLTEKDLELLNGLVIRSGKIVAIDHIRDEQGKLYAKSQSQALRNRLAALVKKGWLIRLKRGMYLVVTDITALGMGDASDYIIAKALNRNSYVSFEAALQHYSMYDQKLAVLDGVTSERARTYEVKDNKTYRFFHIKKDLFFGFTEIRVDGQLVRMAEREKALLDMLYSRSNTITASMVLEKLGDYREDIDFQKLKDYAKKYSVTMMREIGFLLDLLDIDTDDLLTSVKVKSNTYSRMARDAETFNAKWRLYYDDRLTH